MNGQVMFSVQPEVERIEEAVKPAAVTAAEFMRKFRRVVWLFAECDLFIFILLFRWDRINPLLMKMVITIAD